MTKKARSKGSAASDLVRRRNASRSGRVHGVCTAQRAVISPLFLPAFPRTEKGKTVFISEGDKRYLFSSFKHPLHRFVHPFPPLVPPPPPAPFSPPCTLLPPLHPSPFFFSLFFPSASPASGGAQIGRRPEPGWGLGGVAQIGRPREQKRRKGGAQDRPPSRAGWAGADPESEKGSGGAQFRPHVLGIGRSAAWPAVGLFLSLSGLSREKRRKKRRKRTKDSEKNSKNKVSSAKPRTDRDSNSGSADLQSAALPLGHQSC